jgi:Flp pilus assembly protein TadD
MHTLSNRFKTLLAALVLTLAVPQVFAADNPRSEANTDSLATARSLVAEKKWQEAIGELRRVNESRSADWNNLMGYSLRKAQTADLDAAERYYSEALRIDPKHRGALEYSGELYLMKGDLVKAEQRLAALDKACFLPCEEYTDLKKAVHAFKDNGNRYVPAP